MDDFDQTRVPTDDSWEEPRKDSKEVGTEELETDFLNRRSILRRPRSKRDLALFGLLLLGLVTVAVIFVLGGNKKRKALAQEEEFQLPAKREFSIPKPAEPPAKAQPLAEKVDKDALALKDARLKSAIIIYQNNSPSQAQGGKDSGTAESMDPNQRFKEQTAGMEVQISRAIPIKDLETKILQGKMIDIILETAINSDLPGMVRGMVSHDVYGEAGTLVLLPRGTRLIGSYNSAIRKGQARVFVVWNRAVRPDGIEIALQSSGSDSLGRVGISGDVNNHFWKIFGTSTLLSLIGAGSATVGVNSGDQNNSLSAYREEVANSFKDSSSKALDSSIDIPPTINVKQGTPMKVFVARDLDFSSILSESPGAVPFATNFHNWVSQL